MPRYQEMSDITSEKFAEEFGESRIEQIFSTRINSTLVFLGVALIICFICIYVSRVKKTDNMRLLIYPSIMFLSFGLFVDASAIYWYACLLPLLVIMGLQFSSLNDFLILNLGINLAVSFYMIVAEKVFMPAKNFSALHSIRKYDSPMTALYGIDWVRYARYMTVTIFIVCMILIVAIYIYERKNATASSRANKANIEADTQTLTADKTLVQPNAFTNFLTICQAIPQLIYLGIVYVIC